MMRAITPCVDVVATPRDVLLMDAGDYACLFRAPQAYTQRMRRHTGKMMARVSHL